MNFCPLCNSQDNTLYSQDKTGEYRICSVCSLVFVLKKYYLDAQAEKARYDLHTNSSDDAGYRKYLTKVSDPVIKRIDKDAHGLDFGSGPGPTLSIIFEDAGFNMKIYDHFYARDEDVFKLKYNFITSTEVVEHLYKPKVVLDKLWSLLNENGLLCILTQVYPCQEAFSSWYYKNDPTHVCFFSLKTLSWLAQLWQAELEIIEKDLFIFKKVPYGN